MQFASFTAIQCVLLLVDDSRMDRLTPMMGISMEPLAWGWLLPPGLMPMVHNPNFMEVRQMPPWSMFESVQM